MSKRNKRRRINASAMNGAKLTFESGAPTIEAASEDKPATFSMQLYSGGPIRPGGWRQPHPIILDLSGMTVVRAGSIPFNRGHKGDQALVGHGTPKISSSDIRVEDGVFSFANDATNEIISAAKNGFTWGASMEATLVGTPKFIPAGKTVRVNGRVESGPVYVAKHSELFAGAFIGSNPADRSTSVSIAALEQAMNPELKKWLESRDIECEGLTDTQITAWQKDYDAIHAKTDETKTEPAVVKAAGGDGATLDEYTQTIRAQAAAEHARIDMIASHCGSEYAEIKAKAISEGWDEPKVELAVLKAKQHELEEDRKNRPGAPAIHASSSEDLQRTEVYAAALHQSMEPSLKDSDFVADVYGEQNAELSKKLPQRAGLHYLCYSVIRAAGGYVEPGLGLSNDLWQRTVKADRILRQNSDIHAASSFSTFSLTDTLSNIAHKMLLRMYREWPSLVERICDVAEHNDFKQHTKIAVDGDVETLQLPPTGEIKHGTLSDETFTNIIFTWARMLSVTRHDFINDDLSAFSRVGQLLGRGAMKSREKLLWLTILEPAKVGSFWKTTAQATGVGDVANHITGGSLDNPGLEAAEVLIKQMIDTNGDPIIIMPDAVITGTVLGKTAENLLVRRTTQIADENQAPGTGRRELRVQDEFLGRFGHIETPYIDARQSIPGSADNVWFLLGDKDYPAFEYAQLRGEGSPNIDSSDTDFNTLGFQTRVFWDYGFNQQNPRGMIRVDNA